jgi:hypothetical protein
LSNPSELCKPDFDTAEDPLIKWLQQVAAVGQEKKEGDAMLCSENTNDLNRVCLMPVEDEDPRRCRVFKF